MKKSTFIHNLSVSARSYIETALFSSMDSYDGYGEPLDKNYDISNIIQKTLDRMMQSVKIFLDNNRELVDIVLEHPDISYSEIGACFWYARNGHGTGFFDYDHKVSPKISDALKKLQKISRGWGEFNLLVYRGYISAYQVQ